MIHSFPKIIQVIIVLFLISIVCVVTFGIKLTEHKTTRIEILNGTYDGCLYVCTHKIFEWPSTKIACMHNCKFKEYNEFFGGTDGKNIK